MDLEHLKDKVVLITGGTGSFGKNFTKHLLANSKLKKLIVFSRDELKQSQMEQEIIDERIRFFLGDIRDLPRLERAFVGVDIVVHAAALKQVPALEYNPFEAVKTNVLGTQNVIDAAIDQNVEKVVLISTDKAAMPANLYGSTKLCAEKLVIAGNAYSSGRTTRLSVVRYGNVVGSRGSIIETLVTKRGAPSVRITDERMTRFWINLEQAFDIVLFALKHMEGGEIFVPKARTMKLADLFDLVVPGVTREIIGIRPGEKLHEMLLTQEEARHAHDYQDHFVILPEQVLGPNQHARFEKYRMQGTPLPADFYFSSDANSEALPQETLLSMVAEVEARLASK